MENPFYDSSSGRRRRRSNGKTFTPLTPNISRASDGSTEIVCAYGKGDNIRRLATETDSLLGH